MDEYTPIINRSARPGAPRARDFFDIYRLCEEMGVELGDDDFKRLLRATFAAKRVPLSFIGLIPQSREFHRPDFTSVTPTVKPGVEVMDFDFYFDYVVQKCKLLESLWKE